MLQQPISMWIAQRALTKLSALAFAMTVPAIIPAETALAAAYPERPITIIVPFAAGGALDVVTRVLAQSLNQALGQPVIVVNRPGAGGIVGMSAVARAKPDGYTLLSTSSVYVVNPSMHKKVPYDPYVDFLPIVEIGASPNVIVTGPDSRINSVTDLIALAKTNPDLISYGSTGIGTTPQLAVELLKIRAKINMVHVPYAGTLPVVQAVVSRQIHIMSSMLSSVMGQISSGQLKPIVQTGKERWPDLPNVPTMAEAGISDAVSETFQAILTPAGTPPEIVNRLANEFIASLRQGETRDRLKQTGLHVTAGGPDVLRARIVREVPMWKDVIDKAGIKPE